MAICILASTSDGIFNVSVYTSQCKWGQVQIRNLSEDFLTCSSTQKCAVLKNLCAVLERDLRRLHRLRQILVKVECCLYIVISNKYGNRTCRRSLLARQVHLFMHMLVKNYSSIS